MRNKYTFFLCVSIVVLVSAAGVYQPAYAEVEVGSLSDTAIPRALFYWSTRDRVTLSREKTVDLINSSRRLLRRVGEKVPFARVPIDTGLLEEASLTPDENRILTRLLLKRGVTLQDQQQDLQADLQVLSWLSSAYKEFKVSDAQVAQEFESDPRYRRHEQKKVAHIFVALNADMPADRRRRAKGTVDKIQAKLKEGEDFGRLAKKYSDCLTRRKDGTIGWISPGDLDAPLDAALKSLKQNQVSQALTGTYGVHFLRFVETRMREAAKLEKVKKEVRRRLVQRKIEVALSQLE